MKKVNKKLPKGYSCCYEYKSSFGIQLIYIRYESDENAIDVLLRYGFIEQAVFLADKKNNLIINQKQK